jgi:hypothetical protein
MSIEEYLIWGSKAKQGLVYLWPVKSGRNVAADICDKHPPLATVVNYAVNCPFVSGDINLLKSDPVSPEVLLKGAKVSSCSRGEDSTLSFRNSVRKIK